MRQLLGYERFGYPKLVAPLNALYPTWSEYQTIFVRRSSSRSGKREGETLKIYEKKPQTPFERLLKNPDIPKTTKERLCAEHALLDPWTLKKEIERQLKNFFTLLGNLNRESMKALTVPSPG